LQEIYLLNMAITENRNFLVSVRLMTYNHGQFIRQAMEGILMQQTDFPFEVVIGDDFSSDDTLKIIKEFKSTEKISIRILDRKIGDNYWKKRNRKGRLYNFSNIIDNCNGKYIALLDGDDYWVNSEKLQKQFDFLEANSHYSMCFTDYSVINSKSELLKQYEIVNQLKNNFSQLDILSKYTPKTLTCFFRKDSLPISFPGEFYKAFNGDTFLFSLITEHGHAAYLDFCTAAYRIHEGGAWSLKSDAFVLEKQLITCRAMLSFFKKADQQKAILQRYNGAFKNLYWLKLETESRWKFIRFTIIFLFENFRNGRKLWWELNLKFFKMLISPKQPIKTKKVL
jgi:glycosyltransferase involved in cell wall biosynthesis